MSVGYPRQPAFLSSEVNTKSSTDMRQNSAVVASRVQITPRDVGLNEAYCD